MNLSKKIFVAVAAAVFSCLQIFASADFDVVVVGTSPILMLEAIYQSHCKERVLVLEENPRCGGAWQTIDICGIQNADLGCHFIGSDRRIKTFFEKYFNCSFVCLSQSYKQSTNSQSGCEHGFYFSKGCFELISNLKSHLDNQSNCILLHKKLESVYFDLDAQRIELNLGDEQYTTKKLVVSQGSNFRVENPSFVNLNRNKSLHRHLYLLIQDSSPTGFNYHHGICSGMLRAMNLTQFVEMPRDDLKLVVMQVIELVDEEIIYKFMECLKSQGLIGENAEILDWDTYDYEQKITNVAHLLRVAGPLVEVFDCSSFYSMVKHLPRWEQVLSPIP